MGSDDSDEFTTLRRPAPRSPALPLTASAPDIATLRSESGPVALGSGLVPGAALGHYQVIRRVGAGGMGVVYEAVDTRRGDRVALKLLYETDARGLVRLSREFRRMADISHPNLVALYELGGERQHRFLAMEFVRGEHFIAGVRPGGRAAPERLRAAARQLTLGVQALHERGRVHRDLKPSNVMIADDGRVVILDFGLVDEIGRKTVLTSSMGQVQGTPAYMAPEQAAGQLATPASDWYAVGVMLHEAVTGALPFTGALMQILLDKQFRDPPPPSLFAPDTPPELDRLIAALLARDPAQRPTAPDIIAWCDGKLLAPERARARPPAPPRPPLAGPDRQEAAPAGAPEQDVRGRRAVVVDLSGPSGTGKTALLEALAAELRARDNTVVLAGRCYEQESVDYKAFDGLMGALARHLRRLPAAELAALLDDSFAALAQIFPVLGSVREPGAGEGAHRDLSLGTAEFDRQATRARAFHGLKLLLYRLALRVHLVVMIDDLQWGDRDSAQLLAELMSQPASPPLLYVGAWRSEDAERSSLLRRVASLRKLTTPSYAIVTVETRALTLDDAARLAQMRLGRADPAAQTLARAIARESAGNPMLLEALVHHADPLLASPARPGGQPPTLELLVQRTLAGLDPLAREVLELVAVAGQPVTQELLTRALPGDLRPVLGQLRSERMIRTTTADEPTLECYHDRIRVAVERGLDRSALARRHRALARALRALGCDEPERLARHLFAAGDLEQAADHAAHAAHAAQQTMAFARGAALYRPAGVCRPRGWELRRKAGDALVLAGRNAEAAPHYLAAAELAPADASPRIRRIAAENLLVSGHVEPGLTVLRPLLAEIGLPYPEHEGQAGTMLAAQLSALASRGVAFSERGEAELPARELATIDLCWAAGKGLLLPDPIRGGYFVGQSALQAHAAGEPRRVDRGLAVSAMIAANRNAHDARAWLAAAQQTATKLADPYALGVVAVNAGIILRSRGAWHDAFEALEDGLQQLRERCQGVTWECSLATASLLVTLEALGELRRLAAETGRLTQQAQDAGDLHTSVIAAIYGALVLLARDEVEPARVRLHNALAAWSGRAFHIHHLHALKLQVDCDLYVGDARQAWQRVVEAWPSIEQASFLRLAARRIEALQLRIRAALAVMGQDLPEHGHLQHVVEADLDQLAREPIAHAPALAALLRAGLAGVRGDAPAVLQALAPAIYGLETAGMSIHATIARRGKGEWTGGPQGLALVEQAEVFMRMQDIARPTRWAAMIAPGLARDPGV